MRALVLGGNRYIGLNLVFELVRQGHDVTVINSHVASLPAEARRWHADRRVPGELAAALAGHGGEFDIVYDNTAYHVDDLETVVEAFRDRAPQLVFTSSTAVYRRSYVHPIAETFPRHPPGSDDPRKAYGVGKVECEDYLLALADVMPLTVLRVGHTIGPMSPLASREPSFFARLELGRPIPIPAEGFPFVQLVHVADVARAMVAVAGNERAAGQVYNIDGDEVASIHGCVVLMARAVGVTPNIVNVPIEIARRARVPLVHWGEGLVGGSIFSINKALAELDWAPQFGLEDAYRDSYGWFAAGGRDRYEFDFSADDDILEQLG
jgi:nucleoside-diphosphate-sugar epimerase